MNPKEIHKETINVIKTIQNIKNCNDIGVSVKRYELKQVATNILNLWLQNKNVLSYNIPSKNIIMNIAKIYDQKYSTKYYYNIFTANNVDYEMYSDNYSETYSDNYSETYSENQSEACFEVSNFLL